MNSALSLVTLRRACWGVCVILIPLLLVGCANSRFAKKSEERRDRVKRMLTDYRMHDSAGVQRMKKTAELYRATEQRSQESLSRTVKLAQTKHDRNMERLRDRRELRRKRARAYLFGQPEQIRDTWAKMVY